MPEYCISETKSFKYVIYKKTKKKGGGEEVKSTFMPLIFCDICMRPYRSLKNIVLYLIQR